MSFSLKVISIRPKSSDRVSFHKLLNDSDNMCQSFVSINFSRSSYRPFILFKNELNESIIISRISDLVARILTGGGTESGITDIYPQESFRSSYSFSILYIKNFEKNANNISVYAFGVLFNTLSYCSFNSEYNVLIDSCNIL